MIRDRRTALILSILALGAVAATADAGALRECMQGCRVVQGGCVEDAQEAYATARADCDATAEAGKCRKQAKLAKKTAGRACRTYTKRTCKPCCKLGGINECRRNEGAFLPAEPQQGGDPVRGRQLLLDGDYMTCGDHLTDEERRAVLEYLKTL